MELKFVSWNVNGLRAIVNKNFADIFADFDADFFCLQETKLQEGQIELAFPGYESYWNYAERKGYSGTAIYTKHTPLSVRLGISVAEHDSEGRVITLEYADFFLVNVYTPNSQEQLKRLDYRMHWETAFLAYLKGLETEKPVIVCGDLNVAHENIDSEELENEPQKRGLFGRGTRQVQRSGRQRVHRYFPLLPSGCGRQIFLVELPLQRPQKQCRLADRLLPCIGCFEGFLGRRGYP